MRRRDVSLDHTKRKVLAGKRIVVTRAAEQAEEFCRELKAAGGDPVVLPVVAFSPPEDSGPLDRALEAIESFDWLLLTSQNAVRAIAERCGVLGISPEKFSPDKADADRRLRVAAVGRATAAAATHVGMPVEYVAQDSRGMALAEELGVRVARCRILLPRSDRAAAELPEALRELGAEVTDVVAYCTGKPGELDERLLAAVRRGEVDVITFFSPSAFHNLAGEVGLEEMQGLRGRVTMAAIGPVTEDAIRGAGLAADVVARAATPAALVGALEEYFATRDSLGAKTK